MYLEGLVSIIIRTFSIKRLPLLKNAVDSIAANNYRPIEVIIVVQTEDGSFISAINEYIEDLTTELQIKIILNKTSKDERAKNLNLGVQSAQGRFIGFLDDDDIFYPNHIPLLVEATQGSDELAWAYSDTSVVLCSHVEGKIETISTEDYNHSKNHFLFKKLLKNNYIPIHSYILDRKKIIPDLIKFDESFPVMEDYNFILKLAHAYQPTYLPISTCEYRFYNDASNSNYRVNQIMAKNYPGKAEIWKQANARINLLKQELDSSFSEGLLSVNTRSFLLARFAFLYQIKRSFALLIKYLKEFNLFDIFR